MHPVDDDGGEGEEEAVAHPGNERGFGNGLVGEAGEC